MGNDSLNRKIAAARTPRCEHGNRHTKPDMGGLHAAPVHMQPADNTLCAECPLRVDAKPGYLGGYSPEMYLEAMHSGASIACHMSKGFKANDLSTQRHCSGVAAYRANTGTVAMVQGVTTRAHESTRIVGDAGLITGYVFDSPESFVAHHAPGQAKHQKKGK